MLVSSGQFQKMSIVSLHTSRPVAGVGKLIIDPTELMIIGFHAAGQWNSSDDMVLLTQDIREITPDRIIIDSADDITEASDLHRLGETLKLNFTLIGKSVVTESKEKLGSADDFSVNLKTFEIGKIHVRPTLMRRVLGSNFLIDRTQIIAVTDNEIIVDDATTQAKQTAPATAN